jgi:hypothetical protein
MATEIRRTYSGGHPVKRNRGYYKPGEPLDCHAQVLAVVVDGKIAISMNGTAVMTPGELRDLVTDIANALEP